MSTIDQTFPVIFLLDEYGEATGTIYFFCSEAHRDRILADLIDPHACEIISEDGIPDDETVCDACERRLLES